MKRITEKEAECFIPCGDEGFDGVAKFFTLIPDDEGWDKVEYYTSRRNDLYFNREGDGDSWVYVLSNKSMPGSLKIGYTKSLPQDRAKQLSSNTGVASPFEVEYAFQCFNAESLEHDLHKFFEDYRISNNREFFRLALDEVKKAIKNLGQKYM